MQLLGNLFLRSAVCWFQYLPEGIRWRVGPKLRAAVRAKPNVFPPRTVRTKAGFLLHVDPHDWIGSHILVYREFEPEVSAVLTRCTTVGQTVLDVGANVGYFALLFANRVGPTGKVFAVEASPVILEQLTANIALNGFEDRIKILPVAAWDSKATIPLFEGPIGNSGLTSIRKVTESISLFDVQSERLDDLIPMKIDCIKFDIEGAELHALRGIPRILESRPPLVLELTATHLEQLGVTAGELLELLMSHLQYECFEITSSALLRRTFPEVLRRSSEDQLSLFFTTNP